MLAHVCIIDNTYGKRIQLNVVHALTSHRNGALVVETRTSRPVGVILSATSGT